MNKIKISKWFLLMEFECPCCHRVMLSEILLQKLHTLRCMIKKPININSGYRCEAYNKTVKGSAGSYHMFGMAADISVPGMILYDLYMAAMELYFTGVGFYDSGNFLHLDVRPGEIVEWKGDDPKSLR